MKRYKGFFCCLLENAAEENVCKGKARSEGRIRKSAEQDESGCGLQVEAVEEWAISISLLTSSQFYTATILFIKKYLTFF